VYFSLDHGTYAGMGHVALYENGLVYTTPLDRKASLDTYDSIEALESAYGVKYLGWAEDMVGTQMVEYVDEPTPEPTPDAPVQIELPPVEPSTGLTHTVVEGDTLFDLGMNYGVEWEKIYIDNKEVIGDDPDLILPGQVLVIDR
jgi:hypothetical protein